MPRLWTLRTALTGSAPTPSQAALAPQDVPLDGLAPCVNGNIAGSGIAAPRWALLECPHVHQQPPSCSGHGKDGQLLSPRLPSENPAWPSHAESLPLLSPAPRPLELPHSKTGVSLSLHRVPSALRGRSEPALCAPGGYRCSGQRSRAAGSPKWEPQCLHSTYPSRTAAPALTH